MSENVDLTVSVTSVENLVYTIRGHKVMLDSDLATLYEVEVKVLNQAVKRNLERFPSDFMFQLSEDEWKNLRSQFVTFSNDTRKYKPYAFSEQGVSMLSTVLKSKRAIAVNIQIMRAFVKMRQYALEYKDLVQRIEKVDKELAGRITDLEQWFIKYARENNEEVEKINTAINYLVDITKPAKIGFNTDKK